jgi:hypothetical protein
MSNTSPHDPKLDLLKPLQSPIISSFATVHVTSKQRGPWCVPNLAGAMNVHRPARERGAALIQCGNGR